MARIAFTVIILALLLIVSSVRVRQRPAAGTAGVTTPIATPIPVELANGL